MAQYDPNARCDYSDMCMYHLEIENDKLRVKVDELTEQIGIKDKLIAQYSDAFDFILLVASDYDGYDTVEGLKKTIDRMADVARNRKQEEII